MKKTLLLYCLLLLINTAFSQSIITGRVLDSETQQAIQGVNITVKGSIDRATVTDLKGRFGLRLEENASVLLVEVDEYEPLKIKLNANSQNLNILLTSSQEDANEARSVGYTKSKILPKELDNKDFYVVRIVPKAVCPKL
ncbi:carboxypeptidase-like regulatory domain-containing protein [Flectobacillus major]|uniref:carboxypeptidase-like regulatory domain-containing protein n=1 Tax=Flectobacillus major TaxID=103 RepID=UPI00041F5241|nr:carboxypeptidase-like regulatory domain-containing protein [Flectobacillus major]